MNEKLARQLRTAFNARDMNALRSLLAESATWGTDPNGALFCRDRNAILHRLKQLLTAGVRATIVETRTGPRGIAAEVDVVWPQTDEDAHANRISYTQAYVVTGGVLTEIHGHDDMDSAFAELSS